MKTKGIIVATFIFLALCLFGTYVVVFSLIDQDYLKRFRLKTRDTKSSESTLIGKCNSKNAIEGIGDSSDPTLSTLGKYQKVCNSFVSDKMMIFIDMPKDNSVAKKSAQKLSERLKEFTKYGITPIVVVEPASDWGLVDFQEFNTGFYDSWIDTFFKSLKSYGVEQKDMGVWVPFPEANIPTWNRAGSTPKDFSLGVNRYGKLLLQNYPETHISILLNSATYDNTDYDWLYGEYVSLKPYVENLDKNIVKSVGLQGFPWLPQATSASNPLTNAREFLNNKLIKEAADILGTKEVWFNTGTFKAKYTNDAENRIDVGYEARKQILDGIANEAVALKNDGYNVFINLFSEDKSNTAEATDWSYDLNDTSSMEATVFKDFVTKLYEKKIGLSLFDQKLVSAPSPKK